MKKIVKVLAVVLVVTLSLVLLCGCSSYSKLNSVCKKEGYMEIRSQIKYFDAYADMKEDLEKQVKEAEADLKEAGLDGAKVYMYTYTKDLKKEASVAEIGLNALKGDMILIIELKSTKELEKQLKENEDLKALIEENGQEIKDAIEDIQALPFVNGNCIFFALGVKGMQNKLDEA